MDCSPMNKIPTGPRFTTQPHNDMLRKFVYVRFMLVEHGLGWVHSVVTKMKSEGGRYQFLSEVSLHEATPTMALKAPR